MEDGLQLASQRLRIPRRKPALAQQAQFIFGHNPLNPSKRRSLTRGDRTCHLFDRQRFRQGAEIDQVVPVTPIARQARSSRQNTAPTEPEQTKATSFSKPGTSTNPDRNDRVIIDHGDGGESDRSRRLDQCVLPPLALSMFGDLPRGGLADIATAPRPR